MTRRTAHMAVAGALVLAAVAWVAYAAGSGEGGKDETMSDATIRVYSVEKGEMVETPKVSLSDQQWRERLTPEQYRITREEGTERAFTGELWDNHEEGVYRCVDCGNDLFLSTTKFESGTGWPSFYAPVNPANIGTKEDRKLFSVRTEVHCARCGAHLGHVFSDGPPPTGLRYCMNSAALEFAPMEVGGE